MAKKKQQNPEDSHLTAQEQEELDKFEKTNLFKEGTNAGKIKPEVAREDVDRYLYLKDKEAGNMVVAPINEGISKDIVKLEREFRRYVKSAGGLIKGLSEDSVKRAEHIKGILNRAEYKWDETITIPGMSMNTTVKDGSAKPIPAGNFVTIEVLTGLLQTLKAGLKAEILKELTK